MRRDTQFWEAEVAFCRETLDNGPGRNFNFSLEVFLGYLQMQAASAFRDKQTTLGMDLLQLVEGVIIRLEQGK
jgi:hypothetical protein